jgi:hypothetical protein
MQMEKSFMELIEMRCEARSDHHTFDYNPNTTSRVGYITKLSINGHEMDAHTDMRDPLEMQKWISVIGIVNYVAWTGQPTDPINFTFQMSAKSKGELLESIYSLKKKPVIKIEWSIYEYDYVEKKYFRSFHTGDVPIVLEFENKFYLDQDIRAEYRNDCSLAYTANMPLVPPSGHPEQHLFVAARANGTTFSFPIISREVSVQS